MPIYEFYCKDCHTIFNFFSKTVNTKTIPGCPKCRNPKLSKQVSLFAVTGRAVEDNMDDLPIDASKMEKAMEMMAKEAENVNEDDPRQAAKLMRKLTDMTGVGLGQGMEEALHRMENGEDPEKIEAEMGDLMGSEDPFIVPGKKGGKSSKKQQAPRKDDTLYDL
jgi:putative FmdB family regulatory protein